MLRAVGEIKRDTQENILLKQKFMEINVDGKPIRYAEANRFSYKRVSSLFTKEPTTCPWIDTFSADDVFFDVGANVGMYSIYAAQFRGCRVFSFEPESQNYAELNKSIWLNGLHSRMTAYCCAISSEERMSVLHLSTFGPAFAHHDFHDNLWEKDKRLGAEVYKKDERLTQGCISGSLDRLVADGTLPSPNHIKVDVDGLESKVIESCKNILASPTLKTILVEIDFSYAENIKIVNKLQSLGWQFSQDQVRINQHEILSYEQFQQRMINKQGGQNFIFFKDQSYHEFFRKFAADYIPPNPIQKDQLKKAPAAQKKTWFSRFMRQ